MKTKILIVDDDAVERIALKEILLGERDFEIFEACDGQEGLDRLCDGLRPELCFIDLKMPRLDGLEFVSRVRRDPELSSLKVVISSVSRDRTVILKLAQLKLSGYLLKPFEKERTRAVLQQCLPVPLRADPTRASRNLLGKTALVVEDDVELRTVISAMVKAEPGWEVAVAKDGQHSLDQLHAGLRPDLCLTDLRMPGMGGAEFLRMIRADPALRKLRVVVISAETDREKIRALAQYQIAGFLPKPISSAKVQALLRAQREPQTPVAATAADISSLAEAFEGAILKPESPERS